jgi:hypothetical protein
LSLLDAPGTGAVIALKKRCDANRHIFRPSWQGPACIHCGVALLTRKAPDGMERRYAAVNIDIDAKARTFEGYAVVWGSKNTYSEVFQKGAFTRTLAEWRAKSARPSFYLNHDWDLQIGVWLDMREDETGLFVRGEYLESAWGDHALALVRKKICTGLSIGFVLDDYEVENEQDWENRTVIVKEVTLYEVSQVERPSDKAAGVTAVRSIRADMSRRDIEDLLRSHGATRAAARAMASMWRPKDEARDAPPPVDDADRRDAAAAEELIASLRSAATDNRKH